MMLEERKAMVYCIRASNDETGSDWYLTTAISEKEAITTVSTWITDSGGCGVEDDMVYTVENLEDVIHNQYENLTALHTL